MNEVNQVIGQQGEMPLTSLNGVCPCLMCSMAFRLVDRLFCLVLRIEGHGIQKGLIGRRAALVMERIGLLRSGRVLRGRFGYRRRRGPRLSRQQELPLGSLHAS